MKDIDKINEWSEQNSFNQLSADKKHIVLLEMSAIEYDELHNVVKGYRDLFSKDSDDLSPRGESVLILSEMMEKEEKDRKVFGGIWAIKMPLYQAIAACFLIFMTMFFLGGNEDNGSVVVEKEVPVYEIVRDTIYREVPVIEYITKTIIKEIPIIEEPSQLITSSYIPEDDYSLSQPVEVPSMNDISRSFGNTGVDAESLEKFKVGM